MPKINILQGTVFVVASYVKPELYEIAKAHGFASWRAYETAVINGEAQPTKREPDGGKSG